MKENKFWLICAVIVIIVLRFIGFFGTSVMEPTLSNVFTIDDVAETKDSDKGKFIGCNSSFTSQKTATDVNGEYVEKYIARNTIVCNCVGDHEGSIIEKTVTLQYIDEPSKVELDCNSQCEKICAEY